MPTIIHLTLFGLTIGLSILIVILGIIHIRYADRCLIRQTDTFRIPKQTLLVIGLLMLLSGISALLAYFLTPNPTSDATPSKQDVILSWVNLFTACLATGIGFSCPKWLSRHWTAPSLQCQQYGFIAIGLSYFCYAISDLLRTFGYR